jgi:hypothetical protein
MLHASSCKPTPTVRSVIIKKKNKRKNVKKIVHKKVMILKMKHFLWLAGTQL